MRPVELQDNLAKTQAAERMNQIQKAHGEMDLRQATAALREKAASNLEKPHPNEKADMVIINKDQEESRRDRRSKKEKKSLPEGETAEQPETPEHLDLKG